VPGSFPKAYLWVAEMEEIAAFLGEDAAACEMFLCIAKLYERIAEGAAKQSPAAAAELDALLQFCSASPTAQSKVG